MFVSEGISESNPRGCSCHLSIPVAEHSRFRGSVARLLVV